MTESLITIERYVIGWTWQLIDEADGEVLAHGWAHFWDDANAAAHAAWHEVVVGA